MSKSSDIRSFFKPKVTSEAKKPRAPSIVDLSSDEDDAKPKKSSKNSIHRNKSRKSVFLSDSDDEKPEPKKVAKKQPAKETKTADNLKAASPKNIFGNKPVKRVASTTVSKELQKKVGKPGTTGKYVVELQEAEFHKDDDFETTLCQLDTSQIEAEYLKEHGNDVKSNGKRKHPGETDEDVEKKKIRRDGVSKDDKKSETISQRENASGSDTNEASRKIATRDEKKTPPESKTSVEKIRKDDAKSSKASIHKSKPGSSRATKKTTEIVFEKHEPKTKDKRAKESVDVFEEHIDKKKQRAVLYTHYLQRGGARNPGSKTIPEGANNCLAGLVFLITGVLDSLERDEAEELIQKYGGRVVKSLSKKTNFMVVGDDAGVSKLEKAAKLGTKEISEDELLDLIKTRPAGKSSDIIQPRHSTTNRKRSRSPEEVRRSPSPKKVCVPEKTKSLSGDEKPSSSGFQESKGESSASVSGDIPRKTEDSKSDDMHEKALVEKYRPKTMNKIIGQHGDKSNAKKLYNWLSNWQKNHNGSVKLTKPNPYAKNDDGAFFKACLLSGPPGVGKTTTAQVVCAELKLDLLEFNASDTRSKRLLKEEVSGILSNTTLKGYFTQRFHHRLSSKHVLLMDEVDGMAGNEDRGGLQELIALIKSTEVPIICICNDRNHPKMRTLSNYTFDLRFQKPRLEQIRGAMKTMCLRENIKVTTEDIDRLILSTNQDIRQVINQLAILGAGSEHQEDIKNKQTKKDLRLGPWDVIRKVFSADEHKQMSIHDKSDLFFHDYNIAGLFVQENYLSVTPNAPSEEKLDRIARSAESLAMGDLIENAIRGNGAWSLLPTQACFSSVIPGTLMSGRMNAQANFPSWLGRNSKRGKFDRLLQEITVHSRLTTGASKEAINLDYLNHLRDAIVRPLVLRQNDGIDDALSVMNSYHLLREDLESLVEVSLWPGQRDPLQSIDSKAKAAFTRAYNKTSAPAPYLINAAPKKKTNQASQDEGFMEGEIDDVDSDGDNDDMGSDRMIKAKKATASNKTASTSKTEAKSTKGGRGRGKAK